MDLSNFRGAVASFVLRYLERSMMNVDIHPQDLRSPRSARATLSKHYAFTVTHIGMPRNHLKRNTSFYKLLPNLAVIDFGSDGLCQDPAPFSFMFLLYR